MEIALIYFAILALAFFFLMVRPQRRRAAVHRQFVAALSVGDEVITSGGIFGTIRGLTDDLVDLEIAPDTVLRIARVAIAQPATEFTAPADSSDVPDDPDATGGADADPPSDDPQSDDRRR